jgi:Tol biopolymer transport system component
VQLASERLPPPDLLAANGPSASGPNAVSADGRWIAFSSTASDLVPNDTNGLADVFVCDLWAKTNLLVSVAADGLSPGNGVSSRPVFSPTGRWVAFTSRASNLTSLPDTNGVEDVFVRDLQSGVTVLVSVNAQGTAAANGASSEPSVSQDGRLVAFESTATDLVTNPPDSYSPRDVFVRDLVAGTTVRARPNRTFMMATVQSGNGVLSPTGRHLLFKAFQDVAGSGWFLRDLVRETNVLLSSSLGLFSDPASSLAQFSADGQSVVFTDLTVGSRTRSLLVCDTAAMTAQIAITNGLHPSISADGRLIAFESGPDPFSTDTARQVWLLDRQAASVQLISSSAQTTGPANGDSTWPTLSANGRYLTFQSEATDIVSDDSNGLGDVFVRDLLTGQIARLSTSQSGGAAGNSLSGNPALSADGETLAFTSFASDLVSGDLNASSDVFAAHLIHADSDGDGLPDDWELAHFGDLSHDGSADSDGDGLSDLQEFKAGTDPLDPNSTLRVLAVTPAQMDKAAIAWDSVPGKTYQLQFKPNLRDAPWTDVGNPVIGTAYRTSEQFVMTQQDGFFRIRLLESASP